MIRLALVLILFASLTVASVVQADETPSAPASAPEVTQEPEVVSETSREKPALEPRWAPRQARRRGEYGPAVTPYPVLLAPTGIPGLQF